MRAFMFTVSGVLLVGLGVSLAGETMESNLPHPALAGGPSTYEKVTGKAKITKIEKTDESMAQAKTEGGAGYEGFAVWFLFTPDTPIKQESAAEAVKKEQPLRLANSWYVGPKYIEKYGLAVGKEFDCTLSILISGTATPLVFELKGVDVRDFSEAQK